MARTPPALLLLALSCLLLGQTVSYPAASVLRHAEEYLIKYGYLSEAQGDVKTAVSELQQFAGLNQTGELDPDTENVMKIPRCGVVDKGMATGNELTDVELKEEEELLRRHKRYALHGSRWKTKTLTYKVSRYPSRMSSRKVDKVLTEAFSLWSSATSLTFRQQRTGKVHIEIRFERKEHGDEDPFDGKGGTLAHAFFPIYGGDVHFDDDENWTDNFNVGTNLLMTASHELGHSLGLAHSDVRGSVMSPFYTPYKNGLRLHKDDVTAIQALYGSGNDNSISTRTVTVSKPTFKKTEEGGIYSDALCRGSLDTIVSTSQGQTFAFYGSKYWRLTDTSIAQGYPRAVAEGWDGLPVTVDASFTWTNGRIYFFKGSQYWRFTTPGKLDSGYPKSLSDGFEGIPHSVDAALVWAANSKIYFFKGDKYWKFDPDKSPAVDSSYPRPISNWEGIPNNLDAATTYTNGKTYFFKGDKYYKFDDLKLEVARSAEYPYPRDSGRWWFGCQ